jgi:hypothetical protein
MISAAEQTTQMRRQPQHLEIVGTDRPAEREVADGCGVSPAAHDRRDLARLLGRQRLERLVLGAQPLEQRVREQRQSARLQRSPIRRLGCVGEHDQLFARGHRQRAQQGSIDQPEHGGVAGDAQRQRQHHRERDPRAAAQGSGSVAQILGQGVQPVAYAAGPHLLLHLIHPAHLQPGLPPGLGRIQSSRDESVGDQVQVRAQLLVEISLDLPAPEQVPREAEQPPVQAHGCSPQVARSARVMARAMRSQSSVSCCNCRAPARVSR